MLHTGDIHETRARAARIHELRRISRAISGFLFRSPPATATVSFDNMTGANDHNTETTRAA